MKNSRREGRDYDMQNRKKAVRLFTSECVTVGHP